MTKIYRQTEPTHTVEYTDPATLLRIEQRIDDPARVPLFIAKLIEMGVTQLEYHAPSTTLDPLREAYNALRVLTLTPHICAYLSAADPQALAQAERAVQLLAQSLDTKK